MVCVKNLLNFFLRQEMLKAKIVFKRKEKESIKNFIQFFRKKKSILCNGFRIRKMMRFPNFPISYFFLLVLTKIFLGFLIPEKGNLLEFFKMRPNSSPL